MTCRCVVSIGPPKKRHDTNISSQAIPLPPQSPPSPMNVIPPTPPPRGLSNSPRDAVSSATPSVLPNLHPISSKSAHRRHQMHRVIIRVHHRPAHQATHIFVMPPPRKYPTYSHRTSVSPTPRRPAPPLGKLEWTPHPCNRQYPTLFPVHPPQDQQHTRLCTLHRAAGAFRGGAWHPLPRLVVMLCGALFYVTVTCSFLLVYNTSKKSGVFPPKIEGLE